MNWPCRSSRPGHSPDAGRIFVFLALATIFCVLSYQLILNHDTIPNWGEEQGMAVTDNVIEMGTPGPEFLEKELVLAAMHDSNVTWAEELSWPVNIYRVDMSPSEADLDLTVPVNKGNEAMVYLTYLIDRYDSLPDIIVMLHGNRYQWHADNPLYDNGISIRDLNLNFVREAGYVNLRCTWAIGCPAELEPARYLRDRPDDQQHPTAVEYPDQFKLLFPGKEVPELVGAPCCSQFSVSRAKIHERPKSDYEHFRRWLVETELDSGTSGRVLEYSWHSKCFLRRMKPLVLTCLQLSLDKIQYIAQIHESPIAELMDIAT